MDKPVVKAGSRTYLYLWYLATLENELCYFFARVHTRTHSKSLERASFITRSKFTFLKPRWKLSEFIIHYLDSV